METPITQRHAIQLFKANPETELDLPFFDGGISAGFPSPALDFEDVKIDLNKHLIKNPSATFFGKVKGQSLKNAGISDGDLMVIDRSAPVLNNKIAVVFLDGEFTAKRIRKDGSEVWLLPENVPVGKDSTEALKADATVIRVIDEAYRHYKPISIDGSAGDVWKETYASKNSSPKGVFFDQDPKEFIKALSGHRVWEREDATKIPV